MHTHILKDFHVHIHGGFVQCGIILGTLII